MMELTRLQAGRVTGPTYRCTYCRKLMGGPEAMHGRLCPRCETGRLQNVAVIKGWMLAEHEGSRHPTFEPKPLEKLTCDFCVAEASSQCIGCEAVLCSDDAIDGPFMGGIFCPDCVPGGRGLE